MVFIKPDITAGSVLEHHDHADAQVPVQVRHDDETDEEPDVEDIEVRIGLNIYFKAFGHLRDELLYWYQTQLFTL